MTEREKEIAREKANRAKVKANWNYAKGLIWASDMTLEEWVFVRDEFFEKMKELKRKEIGEQISLF